MSVRQIIIIFFSYFAVSFCHFSIAQQANAELILVSPHWDGYKREFERAFSIWYKQNYHQEVKVRWLDLGGASDIAKTLIARNKVNESIPLDIIFGGGTDIYNQLKENGMLSKILINPEILNQIPDDLNGNLLKDPQGYWVTNALTSFGILFNKILLSKIHISVPETYLDLAKTEFQGWIGSSDPRKSGSIRFLYELILQRYGWNDGWKIIYKLSSNVRSFSTASSQTPKDIAQGDIAAGLIVDAYAQDLIRELGDEKVGYVVPKDVASFFGDGIAISSNAPHSLVANRFIEFAIGESGQKLIYLKKGSPEGPVDIDIGRLPVLKNLYSIEDSLKSRLENPFKYRFTFRYDYKEASSRWSITTRLLGIFAVDLHELLFDMRYTRGIDLERLAPPIDINTLKDISLKSNSEQEIILSSSQENFRGKNESFKIFTRSNIAFLAIIFIFILKLIAAIKRRISLNI